MSINDYAAVLLSQYGDPKSTADQVDGIVEAGLPNTLLPYETLSEAECRHALSLLTELANHLTSGDPLSNATLSQILEPRILTSRLFIEAFFPAMIYFKHGWEFYFHAFILTLENHMGEKNTRLVMETILKQAMQNRGLDTGDVDAGNLDDTAFHKAPMGFDLRRYSFLDVYKLPIKET